MCDACIPVDPEDASTEPFSDEDVSALQTFAAMLLGMMVAADVAVNGDEVKAEQLVPVARAGAAMATTALMMPTDGDGRRCSTGTRRTAAGTSRGRVRRMTCRGSTKPDTDSRRSMLHGGDQPRMIVT